MNLHELIIFYKTKLHSSNNNDLHAALLFALQLPSFCSRMEFPQTDGNTGKSEDGALYNSKGNPLDGNLYKKWISKHQHFFCDKFSDSMTLNQFCDNLYKLRNQFTHEGCVMTPKNKICFIESDDISMLLGDILFLSIRDLCSSVFAAAEQTALNYSWDITMFDDLVIPQSIYSKLRQDLNNLYDKFWSKRPEEDRFLYIAYRQIFFDRAIEQEKADAFFRQTPQGVYEIWDAQQHGCGLLPNDIIVFEEYNEEKSIISKMYRRSTYVLRINKEQYDRMIKIDEQIDGFSRDHPFDIQKYIFKAE